MAKIIAAVARRMYAPTQTGEDSPYFRKVERSPCRPPYGLVTVFLFNVTAVCASALPFTTAPVLSEIRV